MIKIDKKLSENPEYIKNILLPYHIYDNQFFLDKTEFLFYTLFLNPYY